MMETANMMDGPDTFLAGVYMVSGIKLTEEQALTLWETCRPDPDELKRLIGELETAHECCEGRAARMAARAALYAALGIEL